MTFEELCRLSEQCLPDAPYREMLTKLHNEMLEALAQPEQEPVGEAQQMSELVEGFTHCIWDARVIPIGTKLYTSPPQRTWVGLSDEEAQWLYDNCRTPSNLIDMTEAKLKELNT